MPVLVEPTAQRAARSSEMFRALTHRNFRLFWAGAFLSNIGTWFVPGLLCAALYLVLSLPVSHLARRLERTWRRA